MVESDRHGLKHDEGLDITDVHWQTGGREGERGSSPIYVWFNTHFPSGYFHRYCTEISPCLRANSGLVL